MHIMIDLETLGSTPGSSILSLGAVMFDKHGTMHSSFYNVFSRAGMRDLGLTESDATLEWWSKQEDSPLITQAEHVTEPVTDALQQFSMWTVCDLDGMWGNGSDFDNVLLAAAYRAAGLALPWNFRKNRCYRTIKSFQPNTPITREYGEHHNALNDARNQAAHLCRMIPGLL